MHPFFYEPFQDFSNILLSDETMHHAIQVMRMREGDFFYLVNGNGKRCLCEMTEVKKKSCLITLREMHEDEKANPTFCLAIAFTKNASRMEWLLEKVTEMGIHKIIPIITKRSERTHWKKERFQKIIVSAMLQSQQSHLPILDEPKTLSEFFNDEHQQIFIAHCEAEKERDPFEQMLKANENTAILIGPEGDFTEDEIHLCLQRGAKAVSLGNVRLRTETAGLYACATFHVKQRT
jgi:16S rRNA (uracil1498-N3)-methyltransferase